MSSPENPGLDARVRTIRWRQGAASMAMALAVTLGATGSLRAQTSRAQLTAEQAIAKKMNVSLAVVQQMQALMADKANRSPAQLKMASELIYAARQAAGIAPAPGVPALKFPFKVASDSTVLCDITTPGAITNSLLLQIAAIGGTVTNTVPQYNALRARLPLLQIEALAARSDVGLIRPAVPMHNSYGHSAPHGPRAARAPYRAHRTASALGAARTSGLLDWLSFPDIARSLMPSVLSAGLPDSEGDTTHEAIKARATYGMTGSGVNVGVISDDDEYLAEMQQIGALPANVTVVPGQDGDPTGPNATGEGTAMMNIVHDLAPGANLFFATADGGPAQFAANIKTLRDTYHCNIICDDVYYYDEQPFSDAIIAQAVNYVNAEGALYFSAAGNQGNMLYATASAWEGDFQNGGSASALNPQITGFLHNFGTADAPVLYNTVIGEAFSTAVCLMWSDPYNDAVDDYDVYITDSTGSTLVSASTDPEQNYGEPFEDASADSGDRIYIVLASGSGRALHLTREPDGELGANAMAYVTGGQTRGHNSAAGAFGVAAAPATNNYGYGGPYPNSFSTTSPTEYFSSDGPRPIFYNVSAAGVATPIQAGALTFASNGYITRQKPDVTAADGVTTSVPGFDPFYGTSAATPHAASIAALLMSYSGTSGAVTINGPKLTPAEIRTTLTNTAIAVDSSSPNTYSGYGIVMPASEIAFLQAFVNPKSVTSTYISAGTYKITWSTNLPASSYVEYGPTKATALMAGSATPTTNHSVTLSGINTAEAVYFKIYSATATNSVIYLSAAALPLDSVAAENPNVIVANLQLAQVTVGGVPETEAKVTITNTGSGAANDAQITAMTIGGVSPSTALPATIGHLATGGSGSALLFFPQIAAGVRTTCTVTGTDGNGDTFTSTVTVQIP